MLNHKEIKYHHDTTVESCIKTIREIADLLPPEDAYNFKEALANWDAWGCGKSYALEIAVSTGIACLNAAYNELEGDPCGYGEKIEMAIDILNHKMLRHRVQDAAMKGAGSDIRTALCPICGQPISVTTSPLRCHYCDSRLNWR